MELCELVKSDFTSDKTIRIVHEFAESLEKTVVVVKDYPGFITNRLIMPMIVEAIKIIESVQATKEDVDKVSKCGFKHPLGTIALADFIGLDTVYYICDILYKLTKEDKFAPPKLLKDMVDAGQYGKKTGRGFYEYPIH